MQARDVIKDIMAKQEISNATLAHRMNASLAAMWDLTGKPTGSPGMNSQKLSKVLVALDYKLIAVPRDAKLPTGAYVID